MAARWNPTENNEFQMTQDPEPSSESNGMHTPTQSQSSLVSETSSSVATDSEDSEAVDRFLAGNQATRSSESSGMHTPTQSQSSSCSETSSEVTTDSEDSVAVDRFLAGLDSVDSAMGRDLGSLSEQRQQLDWEMKELDKVIAKKEEECNRLLVLRGVTAQIGLQLDRQLRRTRDT